MMIEDKNEARFYDPNQVVITKKAVSSGRMKSKKVDDSRMDDSVKKYRQRRDARLKKRMDDDW